MSATQTKEQERIATKHGCRIQAGRRGCRARRIPRTGPVKKMEPATTTRTECGGGHASWPRQDRRQSSPSIARRGPSRAIAASASAGIARGSGSAVQITVAQTAASGASIASTALSCMAAKTSVASRHSELGEIVRERGGAVGVVRGVEQELGTADGKSLEPAGPLHVAQRGRDGARADREPQPVDLAEHARCHQGVVLLMPPGERERGRAGERCAVRRRSRRGSTSPRAHGRSAPRPVEPQPEGRRRPPESPA